jgi:hypothetical protein
MPSEWLLRFRALASGSQFSATCADSLFSPDSSITRGILIDDTTIPRPIEAIKAIGTPHMEEPADNWIAGAKSETQDATVLGAQVETTAQNWGDLFKERAAIRQFDGARNRAEAERLAWNELQNRWHMEHGERVPPDLCAGCRRPIGDAEALDLIDRCRVHFKNSDCLIRHGERWRVAATRALLALGLRPPSPNELSEG